MLSSLERRSSRWDTDVEAARDALSAAVSQLLRALLLFDEVYGFLPPHPANPPTKRPLVALTPDSSARCSPSCE
jgi:hypothetical protein